MNNLTFIIILSSLFSSFFLLGCKKFLDLKPQNSLVNENFWKTEKDATMGVMGCYDILQHNFVYNGNHTQTNVSVNLDAISDNAVYRWDWQQFEGFSRNIAAPNTWFFSQLWQAFYQGVARCNNAIANINAMDSSIISAQKAKELVAEVKFIRGLLYDNLVDMFNEVPLVVEPQAYNDMPAKATRTDVFNFIQTDLLGCVNDLPVNRDASEFGRATQGAVYTLLARVNLFNIKYGGTYLKAAEYAKKVMDMGIYSLFPNYEKLFKPENEMCNEIIFPVTFQRGPGDNGATFAGEWSTIPGNFWLYPLSNLTDEYYCKNGKPIKDSVTGTLNPLYNPDSVWVNRDPRLTATIVGAGCLWGGKIITASDMSGEPTGLAFRKWREETGTENGFDSPQYFYVYRFAHVLLMRAEALIMSGDITNPDVNGSIDALRARVGMPSIEVVEAGGGNILSQADYIRIIRHEWRVETAFEGWRYFNLVRWGQLKAAYQRVNEIDAVKFPSIVREHVYAPRLEVFPIPQSELDVNKNLVQNDLWK